MVANAPRNIGQYKSIGELDAKALENHIKKHFLLRIKEKNVTLSEENWKKIIDTIVESLIKQR